MSPCGPDHSLFNESPIHGQLGCFRVCLSLLLFMKTKTIFPTPLVSIYQETCGSLNLPAPAASLHLEYPHLQGSSALAARLMWVAWLKLSGAGRDPLAPRPAAGPQSGRFKSSQWQRVNKPRPRPTMNNSPGRREAYLTRRGWGRDGGCGPAPSMGQWATRPRPPHLPL